MKYLILTKQRSNDADNWGMAECDDLITVSSEGVVTCFARGSEMNCTADTMIVVCNLNREFWSRDSEYQERKAALDKIKSEMGSPRIWVHFGDLNKTDVKTQTIAEKWADKVYEDYRKVFSEKDCGPMPHSRGSQQDWDEVIIEFSSKIIGALGREDKGQINNFEGELKKLDDAWRKAVEKYPLEEFNRTNRNEIIHKQLIPLLPIAIYCNGLVYAVEKKNSENDSAFLDALNNMRECFKKHVPKIAGENIKKIEDKTGKGILCELSEEMDEPDKIDKGAQQFFKWYSKMAKKYEV